MGVRWLATAFPELNITTQTITAGGRARTLVAATLMSPVCAAATKEKGPGMHHHSEAFNFVASVYLPWLYFAPPGTRTFFALTISTFEISVEIFTGRKSAFFSGVTWKIRKYWLLSIR
jgi:hypothetical protein